MVGSPCADAHVTYTHAGGGEAMTVAEGGELPPPPISGLSEKSGSRPNSRPASRGPKREEAAAALLAELQQQVCACVCVCECMCVNECVYVSN